jgi:hypothetical protein
MYTIRMSIRHLLCLVVDLGLEPRTLNECLRVTASPHSHSRNLPYTQKPTIKWVGGVIENDADSAYVYLLPSLLLPKSNRQSTHKVASLMLSPKNPQLRGLVGKEVGYLPYTFVLSTTLACLANHIQCCFSSVR